MWCKILSLLVKFAIASLTTFLPIQVIKQGKKIMVEGFLRRMADSFLNPDDQQYNDDENRRVDPASEDPYGDPADLGQFGNVRPASEDPYGDPADEENRWA